jgi:hypothetical protein
MDKLVYGQNSKKKKMEKEKKEKEKNNKGDNKKEKDNKEEKKGDKEKKQKRRWEKLYKKEKSTLESIFNLNSNNSEEILNFSKNFSTLGLLHLLYIHTTETNHFHVTFRQISELFTKTRLRHINIRRHEWWMISHKVHTAHKLKFDFIDELEFILPKLSKLARQCLIESYFKSKNPDFGYLTEMKQVVQLMDKYDINISQLPSHFFETIYTSFDRQEKIISTYQELMTPLCNHVWNKPIIFKDIILKEFDSEKKQGISTRIAIFGKWAEKIEEEYLFHLGYPSTLMRIPNKAAFQKKEYFKYAAADNDRFMINMAFAFRNKWLDPKETLTYFSPEEEEEEEKGVKRATQNDATIYTFILHFLPTVEKNDEKILDTLIQYQKQFIWNQNSLVYMQYIPHVKRRMLKLNNEEMNENYIFEKHNEIKRKIEIVFKERFINDEFVLLGDDIRMNIVDVVYYIEQIYNPSEEKDRLCNETTLLKFLKHTLHMNPLVTQLIFVQYLSLLTRRFLLSVMHLPFTYAQFRDHWTLSYIYLDCGGSFLTMFSSYANNILFDFDDPYLIILQIITKSINWNKLQDEQKQNFLLYMNYHLEFIQSKSLLVDQMGYDVVQWIQLYLKDQSRDNPTEKELYREFINYFQFTYNDIGSKSLTLLFDRFQLYATQDLPAHQNNALCLFSQNQYSPQKHDLPNVKNSFELYCHTNPSYLPSRKQIYLESYLTHWLQLITKDKNEIHILTFIQQQKLSSLSEIINDWITRPLKRAQILKDWKEMMKNMKIPVTENDLLLFNCMEFVEFIFETLMEEKSTISFEEATRKRQREEKKDENDQKDSKKQKSSFSSSSSSTSMVDID